MPMLTTFAQDVEIAVKPRSRHDEAGRITFIRRPSLIDEGDDS
jgi:hypothetical protein